jgi:exonuclease III
MPNNYWEKLDCWESLLGIRDSGFHQNCIIVGDFNITIHLSEKRGGSIFRYPSRENMEDLISTLDLFDVQPSKGKFTWNNRRVGPGHIATRLDHFLIHNSFLSLLMRSPLR